MFFQQASHSLRVQNLLMELNRAVCIEHPEEQIPWFHEKFCKEHIETGTLLIVVYDLIWNWGLE